MGFVLVQHVKSRPSGPTELPMLEAKKKKGGGYKRTLYQKCRQLYPGRPTRGVPWHISGSSCLRQTAALSAATWETAQQCKSIVRLFVPWCFFCAVVRVSPSFSEGGGPFRLWMGMGMGMGSWGQSKAKQSKL